MLVTVTLNAAIDKTYRLSHFRSGELHRTADVLSLPGGKGINVARVAKALGQDVVASGFVAGHNGRFIEEGCKSEGITSSFIETGGESRLCLAFLDEQEKTVTEVLEQGPEPSEEEIIRLQTRLIELADHAQYMVFSGSLPGGVPAETYAALIRSIAGKGTACVLDTSGSGLLEGLKATPALIKPNRPEAEAILGFSLDSEEARCRAIRELRERGAQRVLLSLGEEGAWFGDGKETWRISAIPLADAEVKNTVGCGDSMLAGVLVGRLRGLAWPDAIWLGMACGAANTRSFGAGMIAPDDVQRLRSQPMHVERVE
ncbi:putative fructose-1-phosphate kinase [Brevibacillus brevis NBRC 100599]|uniref:Tagatose-6-phosphate kinase n=1 Tax=Brevibacillus brevis (strain 47 / JCM 6285 / NBRC 100599) TaxID=358681 RepID=C0Z9T3_BREBN|nr:1-phosphofructokinase family hexose kinase [Brevibacillus brevis]BAH46787.1 putative fructose-1-phosphate kinase [Brevibacillus brevis NBRC 100599]